MAVQVVIYHHMSVLVQLVLAVVVLDIDVVAGVVLATSLGNCHEDRIVFEARAVGALRWIVVPLLKKQNAGFGAGMGFEGVGVQADHRQNTGVLGNKVPGRIGRKCC